MCTKKLAITLTLVSMGLLFGQLEQMDNEAQGSSSTQNVDGFERENQRHYRVGSMKLSFAECYGGILNTDPTFVLNIDNHLEVVDSIAEAVAFVKAAKGNSSFMALMPTIDRMQMHASFCDQSQAGKEQALLAAVQAELYKR